jgi:putative transposase
VSFYLVAGQGASTDPSPVGQHLPTQRPRRYPWDTDDDEWAVLAPYVPVGGPTAQGGRPPQYPRRDIVDAIRYVDRTSCQWRAWPADFPALEHRLPLLPRLEPRRHPDPHARRATHAGPPSPGSKPRSHGYGGGLPDVRAAETVGKASRGYDAGKKINGRKRHIVVDTCGLLLVVLVTGACVQDRDADRLLNRPTDRVRLCFDCCEPIQYKRGQGPTTGRAVIHQRQA